MREQRRIRGDDDDDGAFFAEGVVCARGGGRAGGRRLRQFLANGCACDALVRDTAAAASGVDPTVGVVTVARTKPVPAPPPGPHRWATTDPTGALRSALPSLPTGTGEASALLIDATGTVVAVVPSTRSVDDFRADLVKLRR